LEKSNKPKKEEKRNLKTRMIFEVSINFNISKKITTSLVDWARYSLGNRKEFP